MMTMLAALKRHIIFRKLIVAIVLLSNAFAQNALTPAFGHNGELTIVRAAHPAAADPSGFNPAYKLSLLNPVQDKNFYLLSLLQRNRAVRKLLSKNEGLHSLTTKRLLDLKKAESCKDVGCFDELIRFNGPIIEAVAGTLNTLANEPAFKLLAKKHLRPSGVFTKYVGQSDAQMLVAAWRDAAAGLNRILSVYCLGKDPRYPAIDKVSFDVSKEAYRDQIKTKIAEIRFSNEPLFFEPTLNFALKLL